MLKGVLFGTVAVMALCSVLWARQGVVYLTDGTQLTGDVDDHDPNVVVVLSRGVRSTVERDQVSAVEYPGNLDDQFASTMARLKPNDVSGRLGVARWAMERRRFDLARRAAADALAIDHSNPDVIDLMRTIDYEASLPVNDAVSSTPTHRMIVRRAPVKTVFITDDQVNEIRQSELQTADEGFRVSFRNDVRQKYLASVGGDARAFYSLSLSEQARQILAAGDAEMDRDVIIMSDPVAMAEYRTRIQPILMGGCAISGCHDAETRAGHFGLFTHDDSPQAAYTNFLLLQAYVTAAKSAHHLRLVDRAFADKSLLAEFGLPPEKTPDPHPTERFMHPTFSGRNDPRYQSLLHWMGMTLRIDGGNYSDIDYQPPWLAPPSTQPVKP